LVHHAIEVRITSAKLPRDPIPPARRNPLAVCHHIELAVPSRRADCVDAQPLLDKGHETRDLHSVVLSRRAMNDLDLHSSSYLPPSRMVADPIRQAAGKFNPYRPDRVFRGCGSEKSCGRVLVRNQSLPTDVRLRTKPSQSRLVARLVARGDEKSSGLQFRDKDLFLAQKI
jgi:hypothetical protein